MESALVHVSCAHCLATNRVPQHRLTEDPVCGRCGTALLDGQPLSLDDASFERFTQNTELPVLVDFWATWCGPCQQTAPQFAQAARQLKGRALLVKVDTDASPATAARFRIRSIPTLVRLQRGAERAREAGARQAAHIVSMLA